MATAWRSSYTGVMGKKIDRRWARLDRAARTAPRPPRPEDAGVTLLHALLAPRLRDVYAPLAAPWPEDDRALVHDTRVASRRFVEALELARPLLGGEPYRAVKAEAKALRRALGARREADVMRADFRALVDEAGLPLEVAEPVDAALAASGAEGFAVAQARWTPRRASKAAERGLELLGAAAPERSWRELGAAHLHRRATRPEARLPALGDPSATPAHHALRVDFKRLRYTTEILGEVFPEALAPEARLPELKGIQDALGVLQDADDLIAFLGREVVTGALDADSLARLHALAADRKRERYARARDHVLDAAPALLGQLRRAAGHIGPFPRT